MNVIEKKLREAIGLLKSIQKDLQKAEENQPKPLQGKRILVGIGHARPGDFGADCVHCSQTTTEYGWNTVIGEHLRDDLEALGAKVLLLKDYGEVSDNYLSYSQAMNWVADQSKIFRSDVAVELHANSAPHEGACGFETLITGSYKSKILGSCLQNEMAELFQSEPNRGVKERKRSDRGSGFLYRLAAPCAILEPIFISNKDSWNRYKNKRQEIASCYSRGICKYFEQVS